jgi:hypothetical protein
MIAVVALPRERPGCAQSKGRSTATSCMNRLPNCRAQGVVAGELAVPYPPSLVPVEVDDERPLIIDRHAAAGVAVGLIVDEQEVLA